jgi:hypothetical protein
VTMRLSEDVVVISKAWQRTQGFPIKA